MDVFLDGVEQAAVAYQDGLGNVLGRRFAFLTNPTGTGQTLSTGTAASNPQVALNGNNTIVHFAQNFRDFVADFSLFNALTAVSTTTTSTRVANDISSSENFSVNLAVRAWIDTGTAPSVVRYQLLNGNTPVGAIRTVQSPLATDFQGDFREVSVSMYGTGEFVIAFDQVIDANNASVHFAAFDNTGAQLYDVVTINTPNPINRSPDIAARDGFVKGFHLVWKSFATPTDNGNVVIRRFLYHDATPHPSARVGPRVISGTNVPGTNLDPPAVAVNEVGDGVVVWAANAFLPRSQVYIAPIPRDANLAF